MLRQQFRASARQGNKPWRKPRLFDRSTALPLLATEKLMLIQRSLERKVEEMAQAARERVESDADWESRLQEAVDSAEQWKEFAEKLGKERSSLQAQLADLQGRFEVRLRHQAETIPAGLSSSSVSDCGRSIKRSLLPLGS